MEQDQRVGREVKRLREARRWSQTKLAVESDMSVSGISMIENGHRNLSTATLAKLARALDVEIGDFFPKGQTPLPDPNQWRPSLRSWIDFTKRTADRWEAEFEEREAEWQAAEPHIRRNVKWLPNLSWALEILRTYTDVLEATGEELNYGFYVYETAEAQELFKATRRLAEIVERTKPWYQYYGKEAPRMAEVIDLQRAMAERVEGISARSSASA